MDLEMYKKYPRVFFTAEKYGFSTEDVNWMIEKAHKELSFEKTGFHHHENKNFIETRMKVLLIRLDMGRDEFFKYIKELRFNLDDNDIGSYVEKIGANYVPVLWALTL